MAYIELYKQIVFQIFLGRGYFTENISFFLEAFPKIVAYFLGYCDPSQINQRMAIPSKEVAQAVLS